jgi:hypothetical protein
MLQIQHQIAADVSDNVLKAQRKKKEQFDKRQCFKKTAPWNISFPFISSHLLSYSTYSSEFG